MLLLPFCAVAAPTMVADADPLAPLRAYLENLTTLSAAFHQEVVTRDLEIVEEASGRLSLKKPGRFRWDYSAPFERLILADGERVWMYEADLEQVTVRPLDSGLGETPAALLSGSPDSLDRFELIDATDEGGLEWIALRPVSPESDFEVIRLAFDAGQLTRLALQDRLGQTTRIVLSDVRTNADIDDDHFRFEVPAGADVIGEGEF